MKIKLGKKLNNKGMTLVECIVAITILSVCMIPLLSTFSFCYKYTAKAKTRQRATNIAQDVIETYKADDIECIMKKIVDNDEVLNSGNTDYYQAYYPAVSGVNDGAGYYVYSGIASKDTGAVYDAIVKVTAGNIDSISNSSAFSNTSTTLFNGPVDSCVISHDLTMFNTITGSLSYGLNQYFTQLKSSFGYYNPCVTGVFVTRDVVITYAASSTGISTNEVIVSVKYVFSVKYRDTDYNGNLIGTEGTWNQTYDYNYDASLKEIFNTEDLKSITYVFYPLYNEANNLNVPNGMYSGASVVFYPITVSKDSVTILNSVNDIDLLLYKQKIANLDSDQLTSYILYDSLYKIYVESGKSAPYKVTGVLGNVGTNLYSSVDSGGTIVADYVSGYLKNSTVDDGTDSNQLEYVMNVYVFGHGEAGDLTTVIDPNSIDYTKSRCDVTATVVDNIKF